MRYPENDWLGWEKRDKRKMAYADMIAQNRKHVAELARAAGAEPANADVELCPTCGIMTPRAFDGREWRCLFRLCIAVAPSSSNSAH